MPDYIRLKDKDGQYLQKRQDGRYHAVDNPGAAATFEVVPWRAWEELEPPPTVTPPPTSANRLIIGRLRRQDGDRASWRDDRGPIHPRFATCFPLLWLYRHDLSRFNLTLDEIGRHFHGVRFLAADGYWTRWGFDNSGWKNREVAPVSFKNEDDATIDGWPDYGDVMSGTLEALRVRGLKAFISNGDLGVKDDKYTDRDRGIFPKGVGETSHHERLARLTKPFGDTVAFYETANERWQNAYEGHDVSRAQMFANAFTSINSTPNVLLSAPPGDAEEPMGMKDWSLNPATACAIHGTRKSWVDAIRRCYNVEYENRRKRIVTKPMIQGEPTGPGRDVYLPTNDPAELFGIYAMHKMCGHASVFLNSAGIRMKEGSIAQGWGWSELGPLLAHIPDDIGTWLHLTPGHRSDAPIYATSFEAQGEGPHRVDCVHDGKRVVAMVYGGLGEWVIRSRWNMNYRVVYHTGISGEGDVSVNGRLRHNINSATQKVAVIIGERA